MIGEGQITSGLVSVVICSYNNWPDVEMTTASALQQSYQPVEVIVVDNSSTDATPQEIPRRFGQRVRYIRQPNRECAGGYNTGVASSRGEFIQFVDGDDVLAPNKIEKQVEVFRANPEMDIVYGDFRYFQTSGGAADWQDVTTQPEDDILTRSIVFGGKWNGITTLGALFHRRALERVGPWDESLYIEDDDYWIRAAYAGCRFGHCAGPPLAFKRIRPGQKTEDASAMARGAEQVWEKALGYVMREPYRTQVKQELARRRFSMAVRQHGLSRREAFAKLSLARATSPEAVSAMRYAAGCALILLPGGAALARSGRLHPIPRFLRQLLRSRASRRIR